MIKIYGYPRSRTTRVLWAAEEAGIPYEFVFVDLTRGEARREPYLSINPGGKVPALVDGDLMLTESAAICTYIGDNAPESGLVPPAGTAQRALYNQCCYFIISELEQPLWTIGKHSFALPKKWRVPEVKATARHEFAIAAKLLDGMLGDKEFLLGNQFTAADILAGHTLNWAKNSNHDLEHDRLDKYRDRLQARDALARARQRESDATPAD